MQVFYLYNGRTQQQGWKNHDFFKSKKSYFLFKSDFFYLNRIF